jgi:hypothetical protein
MPEWILPAGSDSGPLGLFSAPRGSAHDPITAALMSFEESSTLRRELAGFEKLRSAPNKWNGLSNHWGAEIARAGCERLEKASL